MKKLTKSKRQQRQQRLGRDRSRAMPEVKRLVEKHGRTVVLWCIGQLREYERKVEQLAEFKREAARLEREISQ